MNANLPQMNVVATDVRPPERKGPKVFHEYTDISTVNVPSRVRGEGGVSHSRIDRGATTVSVRAHISSVALAVFLMVALAMTMVFAMPNSVQADEPVDGVGTSLLTDEVISPLAAGEVGDTFADAERYFR